MTQHNPPLVLICDDQAVFYCESLRAEVPGLRLEAMAPGEADDRLERCQALVSFAMHFPPHAFAKARQLRWYQALGAGTDRVMADPERPPAVWVTSSAGIHGPMLGEMAIFQMLSLARHARQLHHHQGQGQWQREQGQLLKGRSVLVVGTGASGTEIRRLCVAFGMRVVAASSTPRDLPHAQRCVGLDRLHEALAEADVVVLATPYSPATHGLIDGPALAAMKPGAYLVNLSRGGVVDEGALLHALDAGHVAGAALDVFAQEPLPPDNPLWRHPKVIATPHVAGYVEEYARENLPLLRHNLRAFAAGSPETMHNIVWQPAVPEAPIPG